MPANHMLLQQMRDVIDDLLHTGAVVSDADGTTHPIFPVAIDAEEGEALRSWVVREGAAHTRPRARKTSSKPVRLPGLKCGRT